MICSYTKQYPAEQVSVSHNHFSTLRLRECLGVETTCSAYFCPSCKIRHRAYTDERIKVAVSDSTLHQFFAPPGYMRTQYVGDTQHVDYVTIANATLPELYHAFRMDYELHQHNKPLDVVIVAGYADLLHGYAREYILDGYKHFTEAVLNMGTQRNPDTPNTVAIASLLYPPKLSWFSRDGPKPFGYHNQIEKIDWLNHKIHDLNLKNNRPIYLGLHSYGTRKLTRSYTDSLGQEQSEHIRCHRWEHWEEPTRRNKFHPRNDRRFKVGLALNNYFVTRT
jgi:hypothetical protein